MTSLSCDQWELIPSPPAQGGVAAKKHKLESWKGRTDLPPPFVVSENMVIPAAPKHGGDLWPGRNLEIFSKRFPAVGGKVDVRDTWVGVLTELLGSVISRRAEHFFTFLVIRAVEVIFFFFFTQDKLF